IGASNFDAKRLAEAAAISEAKGLPRYERLQPHYNLMERGLFEGGLENECLKLGIGVIPHHSLASGFLTGKYRPGTTVESVRASGVEGYANERGWSTLAMLEEIGKTHNAPIASIALAWLRAQESIVAPIASARIASQLDDLLPTPELTDPELVALTKVGA
ncbi:MAG: aldo/keto reductase, partial [Actinomycetes bacterium]